MPSMKTCPNCGGFAPAGIKVCPHCETAFSSSFLFSDPMRRIGGALIGGAMAITLSACYGAPPANISDDPNCAPGQLDNDNDGFCGDMDCDDDDPTVFVWAEEIPNDGIDQNCDGEDLVIDDSDE